MAHRGSQWLNYCFPGPHIVNGGSDQPNTEARQAFAPISSPSIVCMYSRGGWESNKMHWLVAGQVCLATIAIRIGLMFFRLWIIKASQVPFDRFRLTFSLQLAAIMAVIMQSSNCKGRLTSPYPIFPTPVLISQVCGPTVRGSDRIDKSLKASQFPGTQPESP